MPKKQMNPVQKAVAITLAKEGHKYADVATRMDVSLATIKRLMATAKSLPENEVPKRKEGSSRPRKLSLRMMLKMKKSMRKYVPLPVCPPHEDQHEPGAVQRLSPHYPEEAPDGLWSAQPAACQEASPDPEDEGQEGEVCPGPPQLDSGGLGKGHVQQRVHLQDREGGGEPEGQASAWGQVCGPVHGQDREALGQRDGMGLLLLGGSWRPLLPPRQDHHERPQVRRGAQGTSFSLHGPPPLDPLPAGWSPLPSVQAVHSLPQGQCRLRHHGLARVTVRTSTP